MSAAFIICLVGFLVSIAVALLIWGIWIAKLVQDHGQKAAFPIYNVAMFSDYRTACKIAAVKGQKQKFLRLFEIFFIAAIIFFLIGVMATFFPSTK